MPTLHVCTTCRGGRTLAEGESPIGEAMYETVAALAGPGVRVAPVKCLGSCNDGCAAVVSMPGKWTYLLGRLEPEMAADLLEYAALYGEHPTGGVMPSKRPASLARMILGRVPDLSGAAA